MLFSFANIRRYLKNKHIVLFVTFLIFISCKERLKVVNKEGKEIPLTDSIQNKGAMEQLIAPYRSGMEKALDSVLIFNPIGLSKTDAPLENRLTNWFADAALAQAQPVFSARTKDSIDFCLLNYGGIRSGLPQGAVSVRQVFEIMPFENELVAVLLPYEQVEALIDYLIKAQTAHPISGLRIVLSTNGHLKEVSINGKKPQQGKMYWVLTNDYLLNGGDNMWFFQQNKAVEKLDYKVRNALLDHLKNRDTLITQIDGRFVRE